jgi:SAM-dependent methyltransferase
VDPRLAAWLDAASEDVDALWRRFLRRPIEPGERTTVEARLAGGMSRASLVHELATSAEFARVRELDDAVAWARAARARGERPRNLFAAAGTDERPIEIPWCLARYEGEERVLDVGYAFAEPSYLVGLTEMGVPALTGVDLATADVPGLTSVQADVRDLPFEESSFDLVFAISVLEHVGRDNTQYGLAAEDDDASLGAALAELRRVLTTSGRLLVTVPAGDEERLPEHVVLPPAEWVQRFEDAGFLVWEDELYELAPSGPVLPQGQDMAGWHSVRELTPGLGYGERGPAASAVLCAELRPQRVTARVRLALRDVRYRNDPRRAT